MKRSVYRKMELMVLILSKTECLEEILSDFLDAGLSATVIESTGMLRLLDDASAEPPPIFGSLRRFLNPEHESSRTVLAVLREGERATASEIINRRTGGLGRPNTGILFTIPVGYVEGMHQ